MGNITYPFNFNQLAGTPENVAQLGANYDAITDQVNGGLDGTNLGLALRNQLGIPTTSSDIRRGKSIIATEEARTNTAYGTLTTPDQVANIVLPADGLIVVAYQALWKSSVAGTAKAAIFVGANQLKHAADDVAPVAQDALQNEPANNYGSLATGGFGLDTPFSGGAGAESQVTTGQVVGSAPSDNDSGPVYIFAAAGTYTISVQFKATSGSVTAKDRKLWVWVEGF